MDYNQAADTLKRLARDREAMQFAADAFTALGSIDQATTETRRAYDAARVELADMQGQAGAARADLETVQAQVRQRIENSEAQASQMMNETAARCAQAETECQQRISAAKEQASLKADQAMTEKDHRMQAIMETVRGLMGQESALRESIAAKAVQLGDLEAKYRAAKEAVATMLA